jgi:hypothetical protein
VKGLVDRATLQAAGFSLLLAAPVYYTLEAVVVFVDRALFTLEAPPEVEPPPVAAVPVELRVEAEPLAAEPVRALPVAHVSGALRTAEGLPVPNGTVELRSRSHTQRYVGTSDWRGRFSIPDVAVEGGYRLNIDTEGRYRELTRVVDVPGDGLQLDLVLDPLARAVLVGRMVDPDGAPLPGRTIVVQAGGDSSDAILVTGDGRGRFRVEDVPTGRVTFVARTRSRQRVRGPLLTPGSEAEVTLVLAEGDHELWGRVVEDRGEPVPGANLKLSWSARREGLVFRATRTAVSGADGRFRFSALASGPHQLEAHARGYERAREIFEVSWNAGEIELRLRPRSH